MSGGLIKPNCCPTCKFADRQKNAGGVAEVYCRRYPPELSMLYTVMPGQNGQLQPMVFGSVSQFPKVEMDWSCGEYQKGIIKPMEAAGDAVIGKDGGN